MSRIFGIIVIIGGLALAYFALFGGQSGDSEQAAEPAVVEEAAPVEDSVDLDMDADATDAGDEAAAAGDEDAALDEAGDAVEDAAEEAVEDEEVPEMDMNLELDVDLGDSTE